MVLELPGTQNTLMVLEVPGTQNTLMVLELPGTQNTPTVLRVTINLKHPNDLMSHRYIISGPNLYSNGKEE